MGGNDHFIHGRVMRISIAGIALLSVAACSMPEEPRPGPEDVTVELDAFSGLPNPQWTLSARESGALAARLASLPAAAATSLPDPALGYRGFRIRNPGGEGGIPESLYVSRGGLLQVVGQEGSGPILEDRRGAEALLVEISRQRGYEDVFRR